MDRTDCQILNILQKDCRTTLRTIGDQVGLTPPAVSDRIRRLEEKGVIRGYRIDLNREQIGGAITGFIQVAVEPAGYETFCRFCQDSPYLTAHYRTVGTYNALLRFALQDTAQLEQLLTDIKRFGDSRTAVALSTCFDHKEIPIPD